LDLFRAALLASKTSGDRRNAYLEHIHKIILWLGKKVRCFRIRGLLGFLPKVHGQKTTCAEFVFMDMLLDARQHKAN
jgi:hypothetical protein